MAPAQTPSLTQHSQDEEVRLIAVVSVSRSVGSHSRATASCGLIRGEWTIAQFKRPVLRDLEDSAPYFHNCSAPKFNDVVNHYITMSQLARSGAMRNAPPEFANMSLSQDDVAALVAFLQSLTEDYDDA
jgi:cytochrome c peroxidase